MSRKNRPNRGELVELRHPNVTAPYRVSEKAVSFWEEQGWTRATPDAPRIDPPAPSPTPASAKATKTKES